MAKIFQLLLAACLAVGLYASGDTQEVEVIQSDMMESYYGVEDVAAVRVDNSGPIEVVEVNPTADTGRGGRGRGGHGGRGGGHRGRGGHHRGGHHGRPNGNWTAEQKMDHICGAIQSSEISRKERWIQSRLARLAPETRDRMTSLLAARKEEMLQCCQQTGAARVECDETMRRQRYDRVCNQEEPLCVWAAIKGVDTSSSATITSCCASTGQPRYDCFTAARRSYWGQHGRRRI